MLKIFTILRLQPVQINHKLIANSILPQMRLYHSTKTKTNSHINPHEYNEPKHNILHEVLVP